MALRSFRHVLVDEFQDLGAYQLRMLRQFSSGGMTIAGDVTQSVFSNPGNGDFDF